MEGYSYAYPETFPQARPSDSNYPDYPDHGDGFGEYYGLGPLNEEGGRRASRSKRRPRNTRTRTKSKSKSRSRSHSKERNRSKSRSQSRSRTRSQSRSRSRSKSRSASGSRSDMQNKDLSLKEPSFLDAFRVLYLTPSKHKKNTAMYLATQKRQDRVQEYLKSDGLGSKHWFFYPRKMTSESTVPEVRSRETCDQRVKVDGDFFRKYKKSRKVDTDAPIAKLKRWELVLYKKLGFVQAI